MPPAVTASPRETLDLLSLIDLPQDIVHLPGITGENNWYREGGELRVADPQRKGAKVVAPVSLEATDYEHDLVFHPWNDGKNDDIARLFNLDVFLEKNLVVMPVEIRRDGTVYLANGGELRLGGGAPRFDGQGPYRLRLRVAHGSNGAADRLRLRIDDQPAIEWTGRFADHGKKVLPNPTFPDAYQPGLWVHGDGISFARFSVAIYEGEALRLRPEAGTPIPPPAVMPGNEVTFNGHRYRLIPEALTWDEARAKAESLGGHLATVTSKEEMDFIVGAFMEKTGGDRTARIYLAGVQDTADSLWKWTTGEDFTFKGWFPGAPDRGGMNPSARLVTIIHWREPEGWGWNDAHGNHAYPFLVEWDDSSAAPPPGMTNATPVPTDPHLTQLDEGYRAAYARDAQAPYDQNMAVLNQSYLGALARARATAQQAGKLDEITALDAEKAAIESGQGIPPADAPGTAAALVTLRKTYRDTQARHTATREAVAAPLMGKYLVALDAYVTELTKAGKIDEAKSVKARRDQLALGQPVAIAPAGNPPSAAGATNLALFDGKTLDGWRGAPDLSAFSVQDGAIRIGGARAMLYFAGSDGAWPDFGDFELTMQVKTENEANSGIYVHCRPKAAGGIGYDLGLEFQIANENRDQQKTGSLWGIEPVDRMPARDGQWFEYRIAVTGKTATAHVDGRKVMEWTEPEDWTPPPGNPTARIGRGSFALQAMPSGIVWIKDIRLKVPAAPP